MSAESPMMRRMKNKRFISKSNFPKKGMIRIMIVVFAVVVGVNIFGALFNNDSSDKVKSQKLPQKIEKKKDSKKIKNHSQKYFSFDEVSEIIKNKKPCFQYMQDSITKDGKTFLVNYSIDSSLQKLGIRLMKMYHPKYGAVVAIEPSTGRVLSLVSYANDSVPSLGDEMYCRSIFPAASVFKAITSSAVIEKANYTSQSMVKHVGRKSTLYKYQLAKDLASYTELPLEEAFAHSINPVFARIAMYVTGQSSVEEYANRFGFNSQIPFELPNESSHLIEPDSSFTLAELASGFNQHTTMSPLLGALIASAVCENGKMPRPYLVDSITMNDNSVLYKAGPETWKTPIKESTARELRIMMKSVVTYGTARKSFKLLRQSNQFDSIEYGGKTGSVDKDSTGRVDWFIGFARNPENIHEEIAIGAVTVHGAFWTVHSSYIAAEYIKMYMNSFRKKEQIKKEQKTIVKTETGDSLRPLKKARANCKYDR